MFISAYKMTAEGFAKSTQKSTRLYGIKRNTTAFNIITNVKFQAEFYRQLPYKSEYKVRLFSKTAAKTSRGHLIS